LLPFYIFRVIDTHTARTHVETWKHRDVTDPYLFLPLVPLPCQTACWGIQIDSYTDRGFWDKTQHHFWCWRFITHCSKPS